MEVDFFFFFFFFFFKSYGNLLIVAYDLKFGRCRQFYKFIKYMRVFEVQFTFYLDHVDQHDFSQRSFFKDQISGER